MSTYQKTKIRIGHKAVDRMLEVDDFGRLTYKSIVDFIDENPEISISVNTVCDPNGAYRARVSYGNNASVEEIGEGITPTEAYELAIAKAFKRVFAIDLPLFNEAVDGEETVTTKPVKSVQPVVPVATKPTFLTPKADKTPVKETPKTEPIPEKKEEVVEPVKEEPVKAEPIVETPEVKEEPVKQEEPKSQSATNGKVVPSTIEELESMMISVTRNLKMNPKTIAELAVTELDAKDRGVLGWIARHIVEGKGSAENVYQGDCIRKYFELKGLDYSVQGKE